VHSRIVFPVLIVAAVLSHPAAAAAQDVPTSCAGWERLAVHVEQIRQGHLRLREKAEITCDAHKFFADHVEVFTDEDRLVAEGNVLLTTPDTRISASKVEFNLKTKTGVFYDATGTSKVKPQIGTASPYGTQEAEMQFRGEKLEKLGEKKYRITRGGFTTCLQPTARWEFTSGSVTINVDRYAVARNTVFRVKGVPLLYLPIIYYPLEEDDRATGFLLPSYGNSYIHGQTIRNAFFWAINRSMDLTVMHDWFSKTGQAYGAEFRYMAGPGSGGNVTTSFVDEKPSVTVFPDGRRVERQAARNYQIQGNLVQQLPGRFRLGADANYFSDLSVNQLYQYNPYDTSNRVSSLNANVSGSIAGWQMGASYARREFFYGATSSTITGTAPRVVLSHPEQALARLPVYWGVSTEAVQILSQSVSGERKTDLNRLRLDLMPTVRVPLSRLTWLQATTSVMWRATWWSRSMTAVTNELVDEPVGRRYYEVQTNLTGPVFNRIFATPGLRYAQRWKHIVEPSLTFNRVSAIDKSITDRILRDFDSTDTVVGSVTRFNYALTNRLYAKRGEGAAGVVREVAAVVLSQSYYTDARAAAADQLYRNSSMLVLEPSNFSPVSIAARAMPTDGTTVELRTDYDHQQSLFRQFSAGGTVRVGTSLDVNAGWSKQRQPKGSPLADNPYYNSHAINASATVRSQGNRHGGTYAFNYDIRNSGFINQRVLAYYNPQCCGVAVEFQKTNLPNYGGVRGRVIDRRFNVSFTLAGIGSFSDFFGALGADPYRR